MAEWQPIATAPKDDTLLLVFYRHSGRSVYRLARYRRDNWLAWPEKWFMPKPTNWMPLPEPPSPTDVEAQHDEGGRE